MIPRLRRILWRIEDNAKQIVLSIYGGILVSAIWLGLLYILLAGEFK